ncbi:transmembrane-type terpene cyclase [Prescottella equi]
MNTYVLYASALGGLFWTLAYGGIIYASARDKTYGMPALALFTNIMWEVYWVFLADPPADLGGPEAAGAQKIANGCWLLLNLIIFAQFLRYGRKEFGNPPKLAFFGASAFMLAAVAVYMPEIQRSLEPNLTAFPGLAQNILMSGLFLGMLLSRRSLLGQSLFVAVCKMLGSALACTSIIVAVNANSPLQAQYTFLLSAGTAIIFALDLIYAISVAVMRSRARKSVPLTGPATDKGVPAFV